MPSNFTLPAAIERFVAAVNRGDAEAFVEPFVDDALINDDRREFLGKAVIRRFAEREFVAAKVRMTVTAVHPHHGMTVVAAAIDGEFDKTNLPDPLVLSFYFVPAGDRIAALLIVHNRPES
jgi:hypothetical protein